MRRLLLSTLSLLLAIPSFGAEFAPTDRGQTPLKLETYLRMVIERNEALQAQLLGTEAGRRRAIAEQGSFEPEWVTSASRQVNKRQNTVEQQRNLSGVPVLDERNKLYDTGIEMLTRTGAKVRLGYTLNNFNNNLPRFGSLERNPGRTDEWQSFAGASITQPLLKNAGKDATLAALRLAAINSATAFQEYRRQLMVTLAQAESAYWGVYFAQEQLRYLDESVAVAESILNDNQEKLKAGKGAELDVLEAESGVALRRTKRNEARQRYTEATAQLLIFAGMSPEAGKRAWLVADQPGVKLPPLSYRDSWRKSTDLNPDYIIQKQKVEEAEVRFAFARNQLLPELNLKGSYGLNGLGESIGDSFDEVTGASYASWSVGIEFRLPLGGNIRAKNEFAAMDATVKQNQLQLQNMETQIANAVDTAISKIRHSHATAGDYGKMIEFNDRLLKTERERLLVGKVEGYRVLEVEASLFEVKQGLADAQVQIKRAVLELHLAEGSILDRRGLEFTPDQLRDQTLALLGQLDGQPVKVNGKIIAPPPRGGYVPPRLLLRSTGKPKPTHK
jgi:outer membrane protein